MFQLKISDVVCVLLWFIGKFIFDKTISLAILCILIIEDRFDQRSSMHLVHLIIQVN